MSFHLRSGFFSLKIWRCFSVKIWWLSRRLGGCFLFWSIYGCFHCGSTLSVLYVSSRYLCFISFIMFFEFRAIVFDVPCASAVVWNYEQTDYHRAVDPVRAACGPLPSFELSCVSRFELVFCHDIVTLIFVNSSLNCFVFFTITNDILMSDKDIFYINVLVAIL